MGNWNGLFYDEVTLVLLIIGPFIDFIRTVNKFSFFYQWGNKIAFVSRWLFSYMAFKSRRLLAVNDKLSSQFFQLLTVRMCNHIVNHYIETTQSKAGHSSVIIFHLWFYQHLSLACPYPITKGFLFRLVTELIIFHRIYRSSLFLGPMDETLLLRLWLMLLLMLLPMPQMGKRDVSNFWHWKWSISSSSLRLIASEHEPTNWHW